MKSNDIRQGDVLLVNVNKLPSNAASIPLAVGERVVLAHGEVTGHAHAIYEDVDKVKMWAVGKVKYIEVLANVMLRHEEHTHKDVPPGIYKLPSQVEYSPAELKRVAD